MVEANRLKRYSDNLEFGYNAELERSTNMKKNRNYILHHIDSETGYGLLYSQKNGDCIFLNTLATILWKIPSDFVDTETVTRLFTERLKIPGVGEYLLNVISDMRQMGLLHSNSEDSQIDENTSKEMSRNNYTLEQIYFYATKECNARCYHCYQPTIRVKDGPRELQTNQINGKSFLKFIESALPLGLKSVKISGGEPLLRSDLEEIIRGIRQLGIHVSIETNGFLINDKLADMLAEQEVGITISLDGGSAAVHDSLRGLPGSFERVTNALRLLSDRGCKPQVIMSISHRNLGEVENVLKAAITNGCHLVKLNPVNTLGLAQTLKDSKILLTVDEIMSLYKRRKELESKFGVFIFIEGPLSFASIYEIINGHAGICPFTNILGVLSDGSLSFCGIGNSCPELIFGRIDEDGFDIQRFWQEADPLVQIRRLLSCKHEGVCGQCIFENFCKGSCQALAYGEFKSFLAPDPWCQNAFEKGLFPDYYLKTQKEEVNT